MQKQDLSIRCTEPQELKTIPLLYISALELQDLFVYLDFNMMFYTVGCIHDRI